MRTTVRRSEEVFGVKYTKDFCQFEITEKYTVSLIAQVFKALIPEWYIMLDAKARRDVTNVPEFPTLEK
jgi:hypothetical protein